MLSAAGTGTVVADWSLAGGVRVVCTGWAQGDLGGRGSLAERRRRSVVDRRWTVLDQVHGARAVVVDGPGAADGEAADAAVTRHPEAVLAALGADSAGVALTSSEGVFGVAHVGWKGLRAGVVAAAVQSMRRLGATRVDAVVGPCLMPCCYTFDAESLERLASAVGRHAVSRDRQGRPSLDLPSALRSALHAAGAGLAGESGVCTGCSEGLWSWRRGADQRRQATVAWRP